MNFTNRKIHFSHLQAIDHPLLRQVIVQVHQITHRQRRATAQAHHNIRLTTVQGTLLHFEVIVTLFTNSWFFFAAHPHIHLRQRNIHQALRVIARQVLLIAPVLNIRQLALQAIIHLFHRLIRVHQGQGKL